MTKDEAEIWTQIEKITHDIEDLSGMIKGIFMSFAVLSKELHDKKIIDITPLLKELIEEEKENE